MVRKPILGGPNFFWAIPIPIKSCRKMVHLLLRFNTSAKWE
jgi:hypothetical protein